EDNRATGIGAVEHLFEAQWMTNHSMKLIKDELDLTSKIILQSSDGNFAGRNALTSLEVGDFLVHAPNQPVSRVNTMSVDITSLQNYATQWQAIGNEITVASDPMRGVSPKSGTAWRQTEAVLQESHSLFELMTESKGLSLEYILREYVL